MKQDPNSGSRLPEDFCTKLKGVTYGERQAALARFKERGDFIALVPEEGNKHDESAVAVYWPELLAPDKAVAVHMGYVPKEHAPKIRELLKLDPDLQIECLDVTGGQNEDNYGMNVRISSEKANIFPLMVGIVFPASKPKDDPNAYTQPIF